LAAAEEEGVEEVVLADVEAVEDAEVVDLVEEAEVRQEVVGVLGEDAVEVEEVLKPL